MGGKLRKYETHGKHVIAIDEHNNGFQKEGLPMVIVGYIIPNYNKSQKSNEPFERKKLAYATRPSKRSEFERRAKKFLIRNPDFFYTTLSKIDKERFGFYGRAKAIASVAVKLIDKYQIDPHNTVILVHRIDRPIHTEGVGFALEEILQQTDLDVPFEIINSTKQNRALKKADRTAYYLGGLRFHSQIMRWP